MEVSARFYLMSETSSAFLKKNKIKEEYAYWLKKCPICGESRFKKLFHHDGFSYFICRECSFVFTNPRLNGKGSSIWYNSDYYNAALRKEIFNNNRQEHYYSVSLNEKHFFKIIEIIEKRFKDKNIRIVDIGCSTGSLLTYLRDKSGFTDLMGIDLNLMAIEFARKKRKLHVEVADITEISDRSQYDLVLNTENIEHVNNLDAYIENIGRVIKPEGYLLISTPHNDIRALKLVRLLADHFCAPNHINYFNENTIDLFLKSHGFQIESLYVEKTWRFNLYAFIKSRLFVTDQVVAEPPFEALFIKPIWKNITDRRRLIKLRRIDSNITVNNTDPSIKKGIRSMVKKAISVPLGEPFKTHMILLAKKVRI